MKERENSVDQLQTQTHMEVVELMDQLGQWMVTQQTNVKPVNVLAHQDGLVVQMQHAVVVEDVVLTVLGNILPAQPQKFR